MPPGSGQSRLLSRFEELARCSLIAASDPHGRASFQRIAAEARSLSKRLLAERGEPEEADGVTRVALLASPGIDWVVGFWGILRSGAAVVPLSPLHPAPERRQFFTASRASALLVSAEYMPQASSIAGAAPVLQLASGAQTENGDASGACRALADDPVCRQDAENRAALIMFTSGTTAAPKAAPLSHANLFEQALSLAPTWGTTSEDVLIHTLPLHHVHGISVAFLQAFLCGAETAFLPRFNVDGVLELAERATILMAVPTQYKKMVDALSEGSTRSQVLSRLRLLTSGSAKLPESLGGRIAELFGQFPLERYGMTEIGVVLSNTLERRVLGSCGRPLPEVEIRIVDDEEQDVPVGDAGELWVRGPTVFSGYDGLDRESSGFRGGYFRTGDIVRETAAGDLFIQGRNSVDIIKSGGYKLSALEAEELLREHPRVADAAVVGVPDEDWGEAMVAVVVPETGPPEPALPEDIRRFLGTRVGGYKVPRRVLLAPQLPRNALGKVQKHELIRLLSSLSEASV